MVEIPVIDLAPFRDGSKADRKRVAATVAQACETLGFLVVSGIPHRGCLRLQLSGLVGPSASPFVLNFSVCDSSTVIILRSTSAISEHGRLSVVPAA